MSVHTIRTRNLKVGGCQSNVGFTTSFVGGMLW